MVLAVRRSVPSGVGVAAMGEGGADMSGAGAGDGLTGVAQMRVGRRAADERDLRGVYSRMFVRTTREMLW